MKRITLILGAALLAAISAPTPASAQSCSWWNLACNGLATRVIDNGWHIAGRDAAGNVLYVRRRVDSNGNVVFEQSRRNDYGQYFVTTNHMLTRGNIYDANGERCKYSESNKGYKEECKYDKVRTTTYKAPKVKPVRYEPNRVRVHTVKPKTIKYDHDIKGAKGHTVSINTVTPHGVKVHEVKGKGPKH